MATLIAQVGLYNVLLVGVVLGSIFGTACFVSLCIHRTDTKRPIVFAWPRLLPTLPLGAVAQERRKLELSKIRAERLEFEREVALKEDAHLREIARRS